MKKSIIFLLTAIFALWAGLLLQCKELRHTRNELQRQAANTNSLLRSVQHYKTADSLNVANIETLILTLDEYKKYRADDLATIKALETKSRNIASVAKVATKTAANVSTIVRDSIVFRDRYIADTINCIDIVDDFFVMHGCIDGDKFDGEYIAFDSLMAVETIKYKRFLGFLWKTKRVKDRRLDIVSKNPNTIIEDVEHVIIKE